MRVPVRKVPNWLLSVGGDLGCDLGADLAADLECDLGSFSATCGKSALSSASVFVLVREVPNWLLSVGCDLGGDLGSDQGGNLGGDLGGDLGGT